MNRKDLQGAQRLLAIPALGSSTRRMMAARIDKGVADLDGLDVGRLFHPDDKPSEQRALSPRLVPR